MHALEKLLDAEKLSDGKKFLLIKELLKKKYLDSLYLTAKDLLGYKDINPRTHGEMISILESPSKRKLIVMPRGTFKSSIAVSAYCVWSILRNPNERILIDSELYTNSKNFLNEIKAHFASKDLIRLFGDLRSNTNWTEGEITVNNRTEVKKEASITCGGIETVKVGQHYTKIISDDLNSKNNSATLAGRRKVIQHYRMNTAILEPTGTYVVIGTRYAEDDLIGHIMSYEMNISLDKMNVWR